MPLNHVKSIIQRAARVARLRNAPELPAKGYPAGGHPVSMIDGVSDEDLRALNDMLPWQCFTVDRAGRRVGNRAWVGKREQPQDIPDRRIEWLNDRVPLSALDVLEVGCFEGVHTLGLSMHGARVTAIDSRLENVVKTIVRCALYGHSPVVRQCNVELAQELSALGTTDVVHHVGVLYHLIDPVAHLHVLAGQTRRALMLDTHVARPEEVDGRYESRGATYVYKTLREGGRRDVFSGMYDHAKWLTLDDLKGLLESLGFATIEVAEQREERNGLRVLLLARKSNA